MAVQESVRCRRCWNMIDSVQAGVDGTCPICGAQADDFLPPKERHKLFAPLSSFSHIVARLQWDATVIDLAPDALAWPELELDRRQRLTTLLAGFCVAEEAVSEHLAPFTDATADTLVAWVFFLQRRDEQRHALLFDRVAAERGDVSPELLEQFHVRLPAIPTELAAGRASLENGVSRYHMLLEGIAFAAGQRALLEDFEDGALPGVREGVRLVVLDERWHI